MSVDTSSIDLVALIGNVAGIGFSKSFGTGSKRTQKGPCPFCGGDDRFAVFTNEIPQRFVCGIHGHGCGLHGDAITFLVQYRGITFYEACQELDIDPGSEYHGPARKNVHSNSEAPSKQWLARAKVFCLESKELLWSDAGKPALQWLYSRGLTDASIDGSGLGYNMVEGYQDGSLWGMSDKVWISRGIVIPWAIDGEIWKVNIRRGAKDIARDAQRALANGDKPTNRKYMNVSGGTNGLYGYNTIQAGKPLVLVEGEIDRLSLLQATSRRIAVVATGSTGNARDDKWIEAIKHASPVLVAFDDDIKNSAGDNASSFWLQALPSAIRWLPWAHDVNEMLQEGLDISLWLDTGLALAEELQQTEEIEPLPCCVCGLDANSVEDIFFYDDRGSLFCPTHWQGTPDSSSVVESTLASVEPSSEPLDTSIEDLKEPTIIDGIKVYPIGWGFSIHDAIREREQQEQAQIVADQLVRREKLAARISSKQKSKVS